MMVVRARRVLIALALSLRSLAQFDSQAVAPVAPLSCRKGYVQHYPVVLGCEGGDRQIAFDLAKAGEPKHVFLWQAPAGTEDLRVMAKFPSARAAAENASLRVACAHDGKVLIDSESALLNASSFHAQVNGTEWWLGRIDELDGDVSEIWFHAKGALHCDTAITLSNKKDSQLKGTMQYQWTRISQCPDTLLGCRPCSEAKEMCGAGQVAVCDGSPSVSCHKDANEATTIARAMSTTTTTVAQASVATTLAIVSNKDANRDDRSVSLLHFVSAKLAGVKHKLASESSATSGSLLHVLSAKLATASSKHESNETADTLPKLAETVGKMVSDSTLNSSSQLNGTEKSVLHVLAAKLATVANRGDGSNATSSAPLQVVYNSSPATNQSKLYKIVETKHTSRTPTTTATVKAATSTLTTSGTATSTASASEAKHAFLASKVRMDVDTDISTTPNTVNSSAVAEIDVDHDGDKDVFFLGNDKNRDGNIKWVGPYPLAQSTSRRSSTSPESRFAPKLASTSHEGFLTTTSSSKVVQPTLIPDAWIKQIKASKPSWASTAGALAIGLAAVCGLVAISCCCVCIHVRRGSRSPPVEQRASELPPRTVVRDVNSTELANTGVGAGRLGYPAGYEPVRCEDQSFQSDYRATSMASSEAAGLRLLGHDGM